MYWRNRGDRKKSNLRSLKRESIEWGLHPPVLFLLKLELYGMLNFLAWGKFCDVKQAVLVWRYKYINGRQYRQQMPIVASCSASWLKRHPGRGKQVRGDSGSGCCYVSKAVRLILLKAVGLSSSAHLLDWLRSFLSPFRFLFLFPPLFRLWVRTSNFLTQLLEFYIHEET